MPEDQNRLDRETTKKDKFANLKFHLSKWVKNDFTNIKRVAQEKEWQEIDAFYNGDLEDKTFPWKDSANVNLLITEYFVDGIAVRLKNFLIGDKFDADVTTEDKRAKENVEKVRDFLNGVFNYVIKIDKFIYLWCHEAIKKGLVLRTDWQVKQIKEEQFKEPEELTPEELTEVEVLASQGIDIEQIPEELLPQLAANGVDTAQIRIIQRKLKPPTGEPELVDIRKEVLKVSRVPLIDYAVPEDALCQEDTARETHRMYLTLDEMEEKEFDGIEKLKKFITEKKLKEASANDRLLIESGDVTFGQERVKIYEVTTLFTIDGKKDKWVIYYHDESNTVVKHVAFREIFGFAHSQFNLFYYKENGTYFGRSGGQITKKTNITGNDIMNSALNVTALQILGVMFFEKDAFEYDEQSDPNERQYPGKRTEVKNIDKIKFAEIPGEPAVGLAAIDFLIKQLERVFGLSAVQLAQPTEERKTLGEVSIIRQEGVTQNSAKFTFAGASFQQFISNVLSLYQKHIAPDTFENLVNAEGDLVFKEGITQRDIMGNFQAAIKGSNGLISQVEEAQKLSALVGLSNPEEIQLMMDTRNNLAQSIDNAGGNAEDALRTEDEIMNEKIKIQQEALAAIMPQLIEQIKQAQQGGGGNESGEGQAVPSGLRASSNILNLPGMGS